MNRRELITGVGTLTLAAPFLITGARAAEEKEVEWLFVQKAKGVSLGGGALTLTMVAGNTLYFSDRPERIVGHVSTSKFVDHWGKGSDNFKADPPNATLAILDGDDAREAVVVLKDPQLKDGNLTYQVEVLDGKDDMTGGLCALFIDLIGRPLTPLSYAGVARRTTRRRIMY